MNCGGPDVVVVAEVLPLGEHRIADDGLVLAAANLVLELFPGRVAGVAEAAAGRAAATRPEDSSFPLHAEGLLGLGLELGRAEHPLVEFLLLLLEDFDLVGAHALVLRGRPELLEVAVRVAPGRLATCTQIIHGLELHTLH